MTYYDHSLAEEMRLRVLRLKQTLHDDSGAPPRSRIKNGIRFYLLDSLRHQLESTIIGDLEEG